MYLCWLSIVHAALVNVNSQCATWIRSRNTSFHFIVMASKNGDGALASVEVKLLSAKNWLYSKQTPFEQN